MENIIAPEKYKIELKHFFSIIKQLIQKNVLFTSMYIIMILKCVSKNATIEKVYVYIYLNIS